jgi:HEAT repeat protein
MYAARGLGNTHANEAVTPLIEALGDRSGAVRAVAAEALAGIGDRTAVPAVEAALRRTWNPVWRKGIKGALRRFR